VKGVIVTADDFGTAVEVNEAVKRAHLEGALTSAILRFYRGSPLRGLALPVVGVLYGAFTIDSAVQHWRGRGGMQRGRAQAVETS
jgi:hypothetical protein